MLKPFLKKCLAAVGAIVLFSVLPAGAQETLSAIREQGFRYFADGEFADALPFFEQMIEIQGSSKDPMIVSGMERVYYNAALCKFFTGNFPAAQVAFERYNGKYKRGTYLHESYVYIGDALRYSSRHADAIKQYQEALKRFRYPTDTRTDIYSSIARCYLAQDDWKSAVDPLKRAFASAPDGLRRNRAATLLATAYLKTMDLESIYKIVPFLLTRDSLASRSIAFNIAALEAGDTLFADERYREAFWIHRLVYPYEDVIANSQAYLDRLNAMVAASSRYAARPRYLMRLHEWIADTEAEIKAMSENVENYDNELSYRIARGYMESKRFFEGRELFLRLFETRIPEHTEECLYLAFICSTRCGDNGRTHMIARKYMDEFPGGEWYDVLTLIDGQIMAQDKDWKAVIAHFSEVLKVRPEHQSAAECLYLLGYAHFMEEEFEQSRVRLMEIREKYPQSDLMPDAVYWCAMDSIFSGDFETGEKDFSEVIEKYPDCRYVADSRYRRGVCNYALAEYDLADRQLGEFVSLYPENENAAEAVMTRGDIAGAVGRLNDAVGFYTTAMNTTTNDLNIEQYNHCSFQCGQMLFDMERYADVRDHFTKYVKNNRPESNIPLAVYWIGRAMQQQGEKLGALKFYSDAALRFGKDRKSVGVDMILDEWVALTRKCTKVESDAAWEGIKYTIRNSSASRDPVSALRFQRLLVYRPGISEGEKQRELDSICNTANITNAGPAVLELMLDTAKERGQTNFAVRVASAIISDFTETDYALSARAWLADIALAQIAAEPEGSPKIEKLYSGAIRNLTVIREVYATQPEAAEALIKLGGIYTTQGKSEEADECYKQVLGVREWRPLWPAALLGRGQCAEKAQEWLKAAAYYERIYVMYSGYRAMTAKAYLARAKCLRRGYEVVAAKETLKAMLAAEDLKEFPEYEQAERMLSNLGGDK